MYAASSAIESKLYLIGGWDPEKLGSGGDFKSDIWMFDTHTNEWEEICDMNTSISRHSACTIGNKIIINTFRNVFVIENNQLQDKRTTGDSPVGLSMSACVPMGSHVLIIGGTDKNQSMHNEIFALNTKNWKWTKFSSDMKPRAGLCAAPINNSSCLVFGGAGLDSNYDRWKKTRCI
jgi:N-acetylneuraminic acid mutarotase